MTIPDEEIRQRLRLGEDSRWEFKQIEFSGNTPTSPRREDLADKLGAFANAGGGVLLFGVSDDGGIPGMSREQMDERGFRTHTIPVLQQPAKNRTAIPTGFLQ